MATRKEAQEQDVFEYDPEESGPSKGMSEPGPRGAGGAPNADVDTKSISAKNAFSAFQGKAYDAGEMGSVSRTKPQPEYELVGPSTRPKIQNFETPEQRLLRLQAEVAEFSKQVLDQAGQRPGAGGDSCLMEGHETISSELKILEQKLESLANDESTKQLVHSAELEAVSPAGQRSVLQSLVGQLERMSAHLKDSSEVDDKVTYELHYAPDMKPLVDASKIAAVEAKVAEIEKRLGIPGSVCPFTDLQSGISHLQNRLALLDGTKIDAISRRVQMVIPELEQVLKKKEEFMNKDADQKAAELFEMCHRWNAAASALPAVIVRLQSLKALHQHSGSFAARLVVLEQQQEELAKLLETTNAAVHALQKGMQENMLTMKDNLKQLEERMSKLK